jgi:hypothetical protein
LAKSGCAAQPGKVKEVEVWAGSYGNVLSGNNFISYIITANSTSITFVQEMPRYNLAALNQISCAGLRKF